VTPEIILLVAFIVLAGAILSVDLLRGPRIREQDLPKISDIRL
jgi:hypothetical protein